MQAMGKIIPLAAAIIVSAVPGIGAITSALIVGGASILGGFISSLAMQQPDQQRAGRELMLNDRSTQKPIPIIYGERKVGSNDVYMGISGIGNNFLWIIHALGEGPIEGIAIDPVSGEDLLYLDDRLVHTYGDAVDYWFLPGTYDQVLPPEVIAEIPNYTDNLRHTAHLIFKITADQEKFSGIPKREAVVRGRQLYDFRTDTIGWSNNPVLVLYDYMVRRPNVGHYGLQFDPTAIDLDSWIVAANYCDNAPDGPVRWEYNNVITQTNTAISIIQEILGHFRGTLGWSEGKFWLRYSDVLHETVVYSIVDRHIMQDDSGYPVLAMQQPSRYSIPDAVRVKWVDPVKNWVLDDIQLGSAGQTQDLQFVGFTNRRMAMNMAYYNLERSRLNRMITMTGHDELLQLEHHDLVRFSCQEFNIVEQLMRVEGLDLAPSGLVNLTLLWESSELYNDVYEEDLGGYYDTELFDRNKPPPSVRNVTIEEQVYDYRQRSMIRLFIDFDPPLQYPWFDHIDVYVSLDGIVWKFLQSARDNFYMEAVEEGITYYFQLRAVSIWGIVQTPAEAYTIAYRVRGIEGRYPPNPNPLEVNVERDVLDLWSDPVDSIDLAYYEFRVGAPWEEAIKLATPQEPRLNYTGVKPGHYDFFLNTRSANGLYGKTPSHNQATVTDIPITRVVPINFTTGQYINMAIDGDGYLYCPHAAGVLEGEFISADFLVSESGAPDRFVLYLDYDFVVPGSGGTWEDIFPPPATTWDDVIDAEKRWHELLQLDVARSSLKLAIEFSSGPNVPPVEGRMDGLELLRTEIWVQSARICIKIVDTLPGAHGRLRSAFLMISSVI